MLTIPADFSRSATSTNGSPADARAARLSLRTDDAVNYLDGSIAKAIATTTSAEAARTVTEGYLSAMYAGYGTLHDQLSSAADGAGKLASGVTELTSGADKAANGAGSLASGVDQIASGAGDLASGADKLATGADQAAAGVGQLAGGLSQIDSQVAAMPAGTRALADGAAQVSAGLSGLSSGAGPTASGAASLATGLTAYTSGVDGLAATCAASGASATFCANLSGLAAQGGGLRDGATGVSGGTAQLSGGLSQLVPGATQLAGGVDQLADGMPALAAGLHQSATGAATLASKLPQLATGVRGVADGADQLASGATTAATGADELTSGLQALSDGSAKLGTGASDLSTGLGEGVSKIPTYSEAERAQLAAVAATPVVADVARDNAVKNNGAGLAPYFMALALWVGSLAIYLLLRPLSPRALASGAPSPLVALAGYLPGALLGAAQGAALALVLQFWIGIGAASTWGLIGVGMLIGLTFVAMNQALVGGGVSEWPKEHASKACVGGSPPRVRIPAPPPVKLFRYRQQPEPLWFGLLHMWGVVGERRFDSSAPRWCGGTQDRRPFRSSMKLHRGCETSSTFGAPVHVRVRASGKSTSVTAPMAAPSLLLEQQ